MVLAITLSIYLILNLGLQGQMRAKRGSLNQEWVKTETNLSFFAFKIMDVTIDKTLINFTGCMAVLQ